ncbi:hypothetical protein Clacol_002965 [Clathrus columnatus]|uniref:Uncharacterized protein n=1 Tax=Clathrus columnatus TaxID=1419009 RepID=A0AAV5A259_9AGAM|nr:hypothetical protein Clacol_002965 [Clathrus columnatus]
MTLQPPSIELSRVPSFERSFREETVQKRTLSKHRHASPSAPWPWIDLEDEIDPHAHAAIPRERHVCHHDIRKCVGCWEGYPQSLYPNWTWRQVDKSGITKILVPSSSCWIHYIDIDHDAHFATPIRYVCDDHNETTWKALQNTFNIILVLPDITITLAFPRVISRASDTSSKPGFNNDETIDTQKPLPLRAGVESSGRELVLDMLAMHMIRGQDANTIISYQPTVEDVAADSNLHNRVYMAGQSELTVLHDNDIVFTQELHRVRAYLLHYASLLEDFRKSVQFVCDTFNPAMSTLDLHEQELSKATMKKECDNLLVQIDRLQKSREMWDDRLGNVMQLGFSSVNINDSKYMKRLTEATVRDSAAMKQIAYLTMVFLPATFVASAFGMNVKEIAGDTVTGTLAHYVETAIPLTIATIWVIVALQAAWLNDGSQPRICLSLKPVNY